MRQETFALLLAGTAWAAPTVSITPRQSWLDHWPQFCEDKILRGKGENNVWTEDDIGGTLKIFASMSDNYDKYINNGKTNENKSFLRYIAQILNVNFNWQCDANNCNLEESAVDKCKESESAGQIFLYLDSALAYWNYIDSFRKAIDDARTDITGRLPSIFTQFGGSQDEGVHWTEAIGMMTAGASVAAGLLPGGTGVAADIGLNLVDTIAGQFKPEENTEKRFDAYANTSLAFSDNVEILTGAIHNLLKREFEQPLDWDRNAEDKVHAVHDAIDNDSLYKSIMTGEFAGLDTPKIDLKDEIIRAGLAAPIINAIWRGAKNYVVKFDRDAWNAAGIDICGPDAFPDLRADGENKIGCDEKGSLYMIAHWGDTPNFDHTKYFRDVQGINELKTYSITRGDIIGGSIKNFDEAGFDHMPGQDEIIDRVKEAGNRDSLFRGLTQVWNLPFCIAVPTTLWPEDNLEQALSHHARFSCSDMKDKNGKEWPYNK